MDFRSNKALAESSSASAPSIRANPFPWLRPWPGQHSIASFLFVYSNPSGWPGAFLPSLHGYLRSLFPSHRASGTLRGWFPTPRVRYANNGATDDGRSSGPASAHKDRDSGQHVAGWPHIESLLALSRDRASAMPTPEAL